VEDFAVGIVPDDDGGGSRRSPWATPARWPSTCRSWTWPELTLGWCALAETPASSSPPAAAEVARNCFIKFMNCLTQCHGALIQKSIMHGYNATTRVAIII
jgi:hypothetical protein